MPTPPIALQRPHPITQHGQTRLDDYFWMRDRDDPAVMQYLIAENAYRDEMLGHTKPLQELLFQEMKARIKEDDSTVPERRGDTFYYQRTEAGKQYPIYCRKKNAPDAPEEILIDQNALAEDKCFCRIGAFAVSPDQNKLAYSVDNTGSEKYVLMVKNLVTGEHYPEQIPNIRGGSELGRAWYEDGKMLNKRNTFTDFIACAEHLIADGYTSTPKLAIIGGSAGGLLVGACLTMRPDLYQTVVVKVPFVDVINTMSDPTIPLTTGLNDPRVAFWEPAKFAAKLRALAEPGSLILLKTNLEAGHAGASGRYDYLKEVALDYAFLLDRLGVESHPPAGS